jgi:hypothetical protein
VCRGDLDVLVYNIQSAREVTTLAAVSRVGVVVTVCSSG